jgi:hypothetical protein
MPDMTSHWLIVNLAVLVLLSPVAFMLGRTYKRQRGESLTRKERWMHRAIASAIFLALMVIAGLASADQKSPLLASVKSGGLRFSQKETALPFGPLCTNSAAISYRHATLKVAGAQMFEATLAVVKPQFKRGNVLNVYLDNNIVQSVSLQYGQEPYVLRIPLAGAQTMTLIEEKPFPSVTFCNIKIS